MVHTFSTLLLSVSPDAVGWIVGLGIAVLTLIAGFFIGRYLGIKKGRAVQKKETDERLGNEEQRIAKMQEDAKAAAEATAAALKKEALLEAKEQDLKLRKEFEQESREKKAEIQRMEQRITQKEDALEKKEDSLNRKLEGVEQQKNNLARQEEELHKKEEEVAQQHGMIMQELEKVAQLTKEEAKSILMDNILEEARRDVAVQVRNMEAKVKDEAQMNAKKVISLAIQRCASDHASEITVSSVALPSDDMKARIIGREGRNIRALENATGVELIIDDTPDLVVLSAFDPVRREIARIALEKLIADGGRIQPATIEKTVDKVTQEMDQTIREAGENAMFEVGIFGLHPEIIRLLGRLKYRTSYGQNVYKHSIEVARLAGLMAAELGLDVNLAKRGGLLHDIGKAVDQEQEGTHMQIGADLARKFKENKNVINIIQSHHGDVEPDTIEAILVQAADAISGARPGARRETGSNYVKRLENLEAIASSFNGVTKCYAIQAGREVRVIVDPENVDDEQTRFLARDIAKKIEEELEYPGQIMVNVIRELRVTGTAK